MVSILFLIMMIIFNQINEMKINIKPKKNQKVSIQSWNWTGVSTIILGAKLLHGLVLITCGIKLMLLVTLGMIETSESLMAKVTVIELACELEGKAETEQTIFSFLFYVCAEQTCQLLFYFTLIIFKNKRRKKVLNQRLENNLYFTFHNIFNEFPLNHSLSLAISPSFSRSFSVISGFRSPISLSPKKVFWKPEELLTCTGQIIYCIFWPDLSPFSTWIIFFQGWAFGCMILCIFKYKSQKIQSFQ